MHSWYGIKAPHLGLAAENGFFWRWNSKEGSSLEWKQLFCFEDFTWLHEVHNIMEAYTEKTEGAFTQLKDSNISWNF